MILEGDFVGRIVVSSGTGVRVGLVDEEVGVGWCALGWVMLFRVMEGGLEGDVAVLRTRYSSSPFNHQIPCPHDYISYGFAFLMDSHA
ncbi:hypothetical protein Tco_0096640 [Tanacetum coccineum]